MASRPNAVVLLKSLRGIATSSQPQPQPQPPRRIVTVTLTRSSARSFSASPRSRTQPHSDPTEQPGFTTVSPDEISHFNNLASSWWDPQGPSRILHLMNPLRHDFIRSCRSSVPPETEILNNNNNNNNNDNPTATTTTTTTKPGLRYLDIGCGGGIFAESAARLPDTISVTAIDPSPEVIGVARSHARRDPLLQKAGKLDYVNTAIEQLPAPATPQEAYDVVSVFEVLEHVASPAQFLDRCAPFVRPGGGWLVLSTIARTWTSWLTTNVVAEDLLRIVPRGTHDWRKYVNEDELRAHFLQKRTGWADARCLGVVYVPGFGWRAVPGSEKVGNYFFAVRRVAEG